MFDGPILFGIADADLSAAEIEECIESTLLNPNQVPANEESMRAVWPLEMLTMHDPDQGPQELVRKGSINLKWTFRNPAGWNYWAYNASGVVITTGSFIQCFSKSFGVWVV